MESKQQLAITNATPNLAKQDWMARRDTALETAKGYAAINDEAVADAVGEVIQRIQKLTKQLEDAQKAAPQAKEENPILNDLDDGIEFTGSNDDEKDKDQMSLF